MSKFSVTNVELVLFCHESHCLGVDVACHCLHIATVHDGAIVSVQQFGFLIFQLVVLVEELKELVVERCATHILLCVVELYSDVATFDYEWQYALVVHEDIGEAHGVERSAELKLSVYDIAGVNLLEVVIA